MNSLTLQWYDAGQEKTQIIYEQQPSKNPSTVRIGRDPLRCDIVLSNPTVSGLHAEIYFNSQQKRFYIRNLREKNPPLVDGKQLIRGDVPLNEGSIICLGQMQLKVININIPQINSFPATILEPPKPSRNNQPVIPVLPSKSPSSTAPLPKSSYGLQCPNCHKVCSIEHIQVGCPWCGTSLAAAISVLAAPDNIQ
ncbi:MAG: FHA domain-containing protein [Richelia sp. RM2_1_2]|nr:FHA domain-containing protein [Richelia sp. SM1_7_0]NJN11814.1 FHA domain-containing protein [Richelia sp. RM1_1_1]NJO62766.1 FHA domain-containing protein [Richelia sp. RM2_1_2]NJS16153.1 FHA domain-containing protein [Nostocaceae cyanobacterium CSU_2_110]